MQKRFSTYLLDYSSSTLNFERRVYCKMLGKASTSQSSVGYSGSGALSHVYIQYPPLRCRTNGSRGLFYDDGNKLLISTKVDQVVSWKTAPFSPDIASTSFSIDEGPILSVRYSLDTKLLAVQRSNQEVQIWNRETGDSFTQKFRSESESVLGFFWTDSPTCDIVIVKTSGLDFFSYDSEMRSLCLVDTKKLNVSWYIYTHESRLVLLASGMQCKSFSGYQLSSAGIIRLPKFEMAVAKSEANSKPVLAVEDVHVITAYGRIYCFQVDRVAMLLHSYRFYRDAVVQQGSLPVYSSKIAMSVVDNVLLVHQLDARVVILYDIFGDSRAPISAPLPLLLRGFPRVNISSSQSNNRVAESSEPNDTNDAESIIYGENWNYLIPDLVCDVTKGVVWKIHLDLEAISASSSEVPSVLEFLQRRNLEAKKAKKLCLEIASSIIIDRRPLPIVFRAIDVLVNSYSITVKTGSYLKRVKGENISASAGSRTISADTVAGESIGGIYAFGKSVKGEPAVEEESESANKSSSAASDSEDNKKLENMKINFLDKLDRGNLMGAESSRTEDQVSAPEPQILEPGNQSLNADVSTQQDSLVTSAVIEPDELFSFVFAPAEGEMVGDASYLIAIIVEFLRSVTVEKLKVHPNVYALTIRLLARNERYAELGSFILTKILEPSKEVALQLLESGRQNFQTRKLGLDMLRQLLLHHDYVVLLVQDGYYLEALRYARKNKVNTVRPSLFLEAAYASNDSQHLAAVLRFFSEFIPGFRCTLDHSAYCRVLAEMNSSISV